MMVDKMDIAQNLRTLGLDEKEIQLYLILLDHESLTVLQLSRLSKMPRSTVYHVVSELVEKRFAQWIVQQNTSLIKAIRPDKLQFLVSEKKTELKDLKSSLSTLQQMISTDVSPVNRTNVRYYQGVEGMRQLIWNTLSAESEIVGFSEFGRIDIVGKKFYEDYVKEFRLKKLTDRAITNEDGLDYIKKHVVTDDDKHQIDGDGVRFITKDLYYITGDHSIYNDVYSISYWNKGEIVGIEIENPELVKLHTSIFELLWGIALPYEIFSTSKKRRSKHDQRSRGRE